MCLRHEYLSPVVREVIALLLPEALGQERTLRFCKTELLWRHATKPESLQVPPVKPIGDSDDAVVFEGYKAPFKQQISIWGEHQSIFAVEPF